jgi:hypothetical protein
VPGLAPVDPGGPRIHDGADKVLELPAVSFHFQIADGLVRTRTKGGLRAESAADLLILGLFMAEPPRTEFPIIESNAALRAVNLDPCRLAWPDSRRPLDNAHSAVVELEQSAGSIFNVETFMTDKTLASQNAADRPHKPEKQIDLVNALVHEHPAAVQLARSAPRPAFIVFLASKPFDVRVAKDKAPKTSFRKGLLDLLRTVSETVLENAGKPDAGPVRRSNDLVNTFGSDLEGLFRQDVFARCGTSLRELEPHAARNTQADCINISALKQFAVVAIRFGAVLCAQRACTLLEHVGNGNETRILDLSDALSVERGYGATTYDSEPDPAHLCSSRLPISSRLPRLLVCILGKHRGIPD